ncbi:MAG: formate/nitrite transporter family protein, partial [Actinomycetes bacterium]
MVHPNERLFPGKVFIGTVLEALDTKVTMTGQVTRIYLQRAAMAGMIIAILYSVYFSMLAAFTALPFGDVTLAPVGKVLGSFAFGWALVFIYFTKSELLTSNMMVVTIGLYHRRVRAGRALGLLSLCLLGNLLGGALMGLLMRFASFNGGATGVQMMHAVEVKLGYISAGQTGWVDLFVRAILCNFMINIAMLLIYNGFVKDDLTKSLSMVVAVFIFAYMGFEHSVANSVLFTIVGLREGIDVLLAMGNVGIALLGNYVG